MFSAGTNSHKSIIVHKHNVHGYKNVLSRRISLLERLTLLPAPWLKIKFLNFETLTEKPVLFTIMYPINLLYSLTSTFLQTSNVH